MENFFSFKSMFMYVYRVGKERGIEPVVAFKKTDIHNPFVRGFPVKKPEIIDPSSVPLIF